MDPRFAWRLGGKGQKESGWRFRWTLGHRKRNRTVRRTDPTPDAIFERLTGAHPVEYWTLPEDMRASRQPRSIGKAHGCFPKPFTLRGIKHKPPHRPHD